MRTCIMMLFLLLVGIMPATTTSADLPIRPISADSVQLVAKHIADGTNKDGMLYWHADSGSYYISFLAEIHVDKTHYVIEVYQIKESGDIAGINIKTRPKGTITENLMISMNDKDADGNLVCGSDNTGGYDFRFNTEHLHRFQKLYKDAIRQLAEFFQKE